MQVHHVTIPIFFQKELISHFSFFELFIFKTSNLRFSDKRAWKLGEKGFQNGFDRDEFLSQKLLILFCLQIYLAHSILMLQYVVQLCKVLGLKLAHRRSNDLTPNTCPFSQPLNKANPRHLLSLPKNYRSFYRKIPAYLWWNCRYPIYHMSRANTSSRPIIG